MPAIPPPESDSGLVTRRTVNYILIQLQHPLPRCGRMTRASLCGGGLVMTYFSSGMRGGASRPSGAGEDGPTGGSPLEEKAPTSTGQACHPRTRRAATRERELADELGEGWSAPMGAVPATGDPTVVDATAQHVPGPGPERRWVEYSTTSTCGGPS